MCSLRAAGPGRSLQVGHSLWVQPAAASDTPAPTAPLTASDKEHHPHHWGTRTEKWGKTLRQIIPTVIISEKRGTKVKLEIRRLLFYCCWLAQDNLKGTVQHHNVKFRQCSWQITSENMSVTCSSLWSRVWLLHHCPGWSGSLLPPCSSVPSGRKVASVLTGLQMSQCGWGTTAKSSDRGRWGAEHTHTALCHCPTLDLINYDSCIFHINTDYFSKVHIN